MNETREITNRTLLRGYLSRIRSKARNLAALHFEYMNHPDGPKPPKESDTIKEIRKAWEVLKQDLEKVLGVHIIPWNRLASKDELVLGYKPELGARNQGDPLRMTLGALKVKADRAREKDPSITLMKSWDLEEKKDERFRYPR